MCVSACNPWMRSLGDGRQPKKLCPPPTAVSERIATPTLALFVRFVSFVRFVRFFPVPPKSLLSFSPSSCLLRFPPYQPSFLGLPVVASFVDSRALTPLPRRHSIR